MNVSRHGALSWRESTVHRCIADVTINIFSLRMKEEFGGCKGGACFHAPDEEISVPNPGSRLNDD